jgi:hypothetical protein
MRHLSCLWAVAASITITVGCSDGDLRGKSIPSTDGGTYLVIDDDNGGQCGPIKVDGREWNHEIHAPGPIEAGVHRIRDSSKRDVSLRLLGPVGIAASRLTSACS